MLWFTSGKPKEKKLRNKNEHELPKKKTRIAEKSQKLRFHEFTPKIAVCEAYEIKSLRYLKTLNLRMLTLLSEINLCN